jgi:hypothetical protein
MRYDDTHKLASLETELQITYRIPNLSSSASTAGHSFQVKYPCAESRTSSAKAWAFQGSPKTGPLIGDFMEIFVDRRALTL